MTALLEQLRTTPAFVVGPANDVLAWNQGWDHLVRLPGMLGNESLQKLGLASSEKHLMEVTLPFGL